ncbi:MAG: hypothetical protein ABIH99_01175 [Candidatus Micrarchaeota archaeon]
MKLLLGIGNELFARDSFGVLLARALEPKNSRVFLSIPCGLAPENFLKYVERAEELILADSALSSSPIPKEKILAHKGSVILARGISPKFASSSTHSPSLEIITRFFKGEPLFLLFLLPSSEVTESEVNQAVSDARPLAETYLKLSP